MKRRADGTPVRLALMAALLLSTLAGCERTMRNMYEQPRYDAGEASTLWPDGKAARAPVPGTVPVAAGELAGASSGRRGAVPASDTTPHPPLPITLPLLQRGQQRFTIFCAPCHGAVGEGDGAVVRHGFPRPPSLHEPRLRAADDSHFFDVITQGRGTMAAYANRVPAEDRWAIASYIRALQLSQRASAEELTPQMQAALRRAAPRASAEGRR